MTDTIDLRFLAEQNEKILGEVHALHTEVHALRAELREGFAGLHAGFDRLDARLDNLRLSKITQAWKQRAELKGQPNG